MLRHERRPDRRPDLRDYLFAGWGMVPGIGDINPKDSDTPAAVFLSYAAVLLTLAGGLFWRARRARSRRMSGGQIAALIFALLLLLPGGCFLVFGIDFATRGPDPLSLGLLLIAAAILSLAARLFWVAFRRPPDRGGPADAPPP
jgi:hypothetical protein